MRRRALPVLLLVLLAGCRQESGTTGPQGRHAPLPAGAARELFAHHCAPCHGKDGRGGVGPDLTVTRYKYGRHHDDIVKTVTGGRPGGMPAFGSQLSAAEIAALADHLLSAKR